MRRPVLELVLMRRKRAAVMQRAAKTLWFVVCGGGVEWVEGTPAEPPHSRRSVMMPLVWEGRQACLPACLPASAAGGGGGGRRSA